MVLKIGEYVTWLESVYYATSHPDEAGYVDTEYNGMVINFDDETVLVFAKEKVLKLSRTKTRWKEKDSLTRS